MIRVLVRTDDAAMASNVGGSVETTFRTFDIDAPDLESFLREPDKWTGTKYAHRQVVGVELKE